jgi:manganese transport protein
VIAAVIVGLNIKLVYNEVEGWLTDAGDQAWIVWITAVPVCIAALVLLVYITVKPILLRRSSERAARIPHNSVPELRDIEKPHYKRIAICVDFSPVDSQAIGNALAQGGTEAEYLLIHVVETAGAMVYGSEIHDLESSIDHAAMHSYKTQIQDKGYQASIKIGYGKPGKRIPDIVHEFNADLLVMGAHGHQFFKDLIFGTTLDTVRHGVNIPVLIVKEKKKA